MATLNKRNKKLEEYFLGKGIIEFTSHGDMNGVWVKIPNSTWNHSEIFHWKKQTKWQRIKTKIKSLFKRR